jgi:hypothetical protein
MIQAVKDYATAIASFYRALREQGIGVPEAIDLTKTYMYVRHMQPSTKPKEPWET